MGAATARAAAARGYRGVAGFDVARTADGRLVLLDANFRFNGSTVALLLAESLGAPVVRSAGWSFDGPFESLERLLRGERGHFVATGFWDPPRGAPSLTGLVHGASREEVAARLRELERGGFRSRWREAA